MSGKRLLKRVVTVMLMIVGMFILLTVVRAEAMPIKPDVRKLLKQPKVDPGQFGPARAGWDGPEIPRTPQLLNTTYEQLGPAATARVVQRSLTAAALPDYRALAAIVLVILLLRRMRKTRQKEMAAAEAPAVAIAIHPADSPDRVKPAA